MTQPTWDRPLTDDERLLIGHIIRWGSDGYPVRKLGRKWSWQFRSCGAPELYDTKREATAAFERFMDVLHDCQRAEKMRAAGPRWPLGVTPVTYTSEDAKLLRILVRSVGDEREVLRQVRDAAKGNNECFAARCGRIAAHMVARNPYLDHAGYVDRRPTGPTLPDGTRGWVVLYDGPEQGIPAEDGGRWACICTTHSTLNQDTNKQRAMATLRKGSAEFCDCCRQTCGSSWSPCPTCGHQPPERPATTL